ncbi:MAG: monovalent cation:proton antiporter-2 (CPA2) family protein [Beijerinckiaceae bacterium]|nr:monovalent cation:proton antiporter-2 (CPA2) family protein [Beijerinckiaceae bacterium]
MPDFGHTTFLLQVLLFLGAAVVTVPLFRVAGLSAVLGYLIAGIIIGPSGLKLFNEPRVLSSLAEIGIVMFLFIIGLELKVSRLLMIRQTIAVLGVGQMVLTSLLIFAILKLCGYTMGMSAIAGIALALSATAIALQMLEERGELQTPSGQRAFAVLLFQDMAIVPILAIMPLAAGGAQSGMNDISEAAVGTGYAVLAIGGIVLAGRYLLNPFLRFLARFGAREVMTAAALFVVLGAAELMSAVGMSMALGAFLAGLLLAESDFRHELEADIEPFRGLLLGLFFMSVGMNIDSQLVIANFALVAFGAVAVLGLKLAASYAVMRVGGSSHGEAVRASMVLTPAGEFSFVLFPLGAELGLMTRAESAVLSAVAAATMMLGPLLAMAIERWLRRSEARKGLADAPEENFDEADSRIIVIGSGRFGQMVNQTLLAAGLTMTVIDKDVELIETAAKFGRRVYYGDGARLDVLRAAGADTAEVICVCIDDKEAALRIVEIVKANFPLAKVFVRSYDRVHAIELINRKVDYFIRETMESALSFGQSLLQEMGVPVERTEDIVEDVRRRDFARLMKQQAEGLMAGADLMNAPFPKIKPEPLTQQKGKGKALTAETQVLIDQES